MNCCFLEKKRKIKFRLIRLFFIGLLLLFGIPGWLLSPEMNDAKLFAIGSYSLQDGEGGSNFPIMDQLSSVEEKSRKLLPHCRYQFSLHIRFDVRRSLFALLVGLVLFPNQNKKKLVLFLNCQKTGFF